MVNPTRLDYSPQGGRQFESISDAIKGASTSGLNGGRKIDVAVTTSPQKVAHGLGKPYTGFMVINSDLATSVFSPSSENTDRFITVQASVAANVTIWVF
jgi:hypothetical protein